MSPRKSSKQLILEYFIENLGRVLESREIQAASGGAVEWARRVRELRNEEGYQILSHKDRADLKPNQYLLETTKRMPAFKRNISMAAVHGIQFLLTWNCKHIANPENRPKIERVCRKRGIEPPLICTPFDLLEI